MIDTNTGDLLAAVRDALAVPFPARPEAWAAYLELARDRATTTRRAVDHAIATGDLARAVDLIDEAIAGSPVTYRAAAPMEVAR